MHPPTDEQEVYAWMAVVTALYLAIAYLVQFAFKGFKGQEAFVLTRIFDAATFAGSLLLLWGLVSPVVLAAIGSTKAFLLVAGFGGVIYGLHALKPR